MKLHGIQQFLLLIWKKEEMLAKIFQKSKFCLCFYYSMLPLLSSWHLFVSLIVSFRYARSTIKVFLQQTCTLAFIVSTALLTESIIDATVVALH